MENKQIIKCLLCGGSAELRYNKHPGYQEPDTFNIYHCPYCNTAFSLPMEINPTIYETIYKNVESIPGYNRYWKYAQIVRDITNPLEYLSEKEETYWGVREALSLFVVDKKSSKILEIGSGLGYLTYSLINANYDAIGLDISQTAVLQAIKTFGNHYICADIYDYAKTNCESFDIVILTEVIEHVDKPLKFIESILKLLKPGGRAIITTPNKSLFLSDKIWITELPPVHLWWFSEESFKYIANELNVNIDFINFTKYYKNNNRSVDLKTLPGFSSPHSIFNKNGELITQTVKTQDIKKSHFRLQIAKIPYSKNTYKKLRNMMDQNIILCSDRGIILCSVLTKP
jgi:2-polyprenyl-3-methyl-5-hydroxy-6-metoxy-1,4-benzoquinol methylase